jgi:predicted RNase H-like HicB family nuclease
MFDREEDGRWIAEIPRLPGVMAYGATKQDALRRVRSVALRTLADVVETGKTPPSISRLFSHGMASR